MFDYQRKFVRPRLISPHPCVPKLFRSLPDGSHGISVDYNVELSNPKDFSLDNLIVARVPIDSSPNVEDISLDSLDTVEKSSVALLKSEKFIVKNEKSE